MKLSNEEKKMKEKAQLLYRKSGSISQFSDPDGYIAAKEEFAAYFKTLPQTVKDEFMLPFLSEHGKKLLKDLPFTIGS